MSHILQIVPQLPPAIDGLGDYGYNIAKQLRHDFGIETHFLVGNPTWEKTSEIDGFSITQVAKHSAAELASTLANFSAPILLHYVGYGYARRGCPVWLVQGLERWKHDVPNSYLVTTFHEIYASGFPWTSAFWLSGQQKKLAARLVKLSDRCLTSNQTYAEILHELSYDKNLEITTLPVFSNVGEPKQTPQLIERTRRLVVFGSCDAKLLIYNKCLANLQKIAKELEIQEICDIGVPTGLALSQIINVPIVEKGIIEAKEISSILLDSIVSFANPTFSPAFFAKSGIFASYCAHRLVSVTDFSYTPTKDGLQGGKHYWSVSEETEQLSLKEAQLIADNAYEWYQTHNLATHAEVFSDCFNNIGANCI